METLLEFINSAYKGFKTGINRNNVQDFIFDSEFCKRWIYNILDIASTPNQDKTFYNSFINRPIHIMITFLLGLGIGQKTELLKAVNCINSMPDEYLWMLVSIAHDFGYLQEELSFSPKLDEIDKKFKLLSDNYSGDVQLSCLNDFSVKYPSFITYNYKTIKSYYKYRQSSEYFDVLSIKGVKDIDFAETVDHGIYGGCKCFQEYCDFYLQDTYPKYCISNNDKELAIQLGYSGFRTTNNSHILEIARTEPLLYKAACLITTQHNIFKSSSKEEDIIYLNFGLNDLTSDKPALVTKQNPLLLLMSLVDTIECTKRFYKFDKLCHNKCNKNYCFPLKKILKTILYTVQIDINGNELTLDFSNTIRSFDKHCFLFNQKKKIAELKEFKKVIFKHIDSIVSLSSWTTLKTKKGSESVVRITIP